LRNERDYVTTYLFMFEEGCERKFKTRNRGAVK
jgi:hypothetical protein